MAGDDDDEQSPTNPSSGNSREKAETAEMAGMLSEAADLFRASEIFEGLTPEQIREIIQLSEYRALDAGDILFEEGDPSNALYVIADGEIEVRTRTATGETTVLAELGPGSVVGEMSLIEGGERSATVEALREVELFRVSRDAFDSLREQNRPVAYKLVMRIARILGDRRRETDARVQEVFRDPDEHLESFEQQVHEMLGKLKKV